MNCDTTMESTNSPQKTQNASNSTTNERVKWNDDFFSALTIDECEKHFEEHYENNINELDFSSAETKDKLALLRSCIELLNRLENDATKNLFAGRVLIFLARVIPLFDQSGVNMRSEFNFKEQSQRVAENLKIINAANEEKDKNPCQLQINHDMEEGETISDDDSNEIVPQEDSDTVFERFWGIQQYLNQPNLLYDKDSWFKFRKQVDALVYRMETNPATQKVWQLKSSYMTDPKSLALQVNDVNMRRCFLVQILIVLQYLELPVEVRHENLVLDKGQSSWSATVVRRIYGLLDIMPNQEEGRRFLGYVRHILKNEELWNRWKNEKCKEPEKIEEEEMVNMRGTYHKRRKISDELNSAKPYNMLVIGSPDMSRLWNMKPDKKFKTPTISEYLNIPSEKQDESFKDPNYSFRVLRLLRKSTHFFEQTSAAIQSLDQYLKNAAGKYLQANGLNSNSTNNNNTNSNNLINKILL